MISLTSPVETRAHRWPAGFKLGGLALVTFTMFLVQNLWVHLGILGGVLLLYLLPGTVFFRAGMARLRGLWPFLLLIIAWHFVTSETAVGLLIACRMASAVGLANLVTMTTRLSDMMGTLRWLMGPLRRFGVKTERIELAMALVIRFTPVLALKGQLLHQAWRARSRRRPGWRILVPFAVLAIDDAERVAEALRARGGA